MSISRINKIIEQQYSESAYTKLSDENLYEQFMTSGSTKRRMSDLIDCLKKCGVEQSTIDSCIKQYCPKLIAPGTKGAIRGNMFNTIVKKRIEKMELDNDLFEVCFEKRCRKQPTDERPDWFIKEKSTQKVMIGMNSLALWGGGQQSNRATKYVREKNSDMLDGNVLVNVVCNKIQVKRPNSKEYQLFDIGFRNNTLCYLRGLEKIIKTYFDLE